MPTDKQFDALKARLAIDDDALALLQELPDKQREQLCANVLEADRSQEERVNQAIEGAVRFVPGPFRKRVRKLLFE